MVEVKPIEFTDVAQSTDVKDKNKKSVPKAFGAASGDKYVRQVANLVIGKNPIFKIGRALAIEYGDDVAKLGKKYKDEIFDAVFSKINILQEKKHNGGETLCLNLEKNLKKILIL